MTKQDFALPARETLRSISGLDLFRRIMSGEEPNAPFLNLIGARIAEVSEGRVVYKSMPGPQHYNPMGVAHGGYASTLLDSAMGCAIHTVCKPGTGNLTLELKVNLVRAITADVGELTAEGSIIHQGRRIATADGRIVDADGKLYAHANTTCMIVPIP
ncbi:MAG: PaaI family thioesterase [Alphaproteobacteria bacterium]|jgi:uncharacterized protein (TIGR00369 family)|nr:PaaI family thioesterase [Alphaproteobacteria bacterium]